MEMKKFAETILSPDFRQDYESIEKMSNKQNLQSLQLVSKLEELFLSNFEKFLVLFIHIITNNYYYHI